MGTLSKRPLRDFGIDIKEKIEEFRSNVGGKLDEIGAKARAEAGRDGAALAKRVERLTTSLPARTWLGLAGGALIGSVALKLIGRNHMSIFVGQWVPTFLILGLYNNLVTAAGRTRAAR